MLKSDEKVLRAIKETEKWIDNGRGKKDYINYKITFYGCQKQNLSGYRRILGKDKRKLKGWFKELYRVI